MADQLFVVNTLEDSADFSNAILSFRKAIECAITYAQAAPTTSEPIRIMFDESLFSGDEAAVILESTVNIPEGAFGDHPVIISAPESKTVAISALQAVAPLAVASGNDVTYSNVVIESAPAAAPQIAAASNLTANKVHLYINPDYTDPELDDTHFRTIEDALNARSDATEITVEKAGATTTIGALTTSAKIFGGASITTAATYSDNSALIVTVPVGQSASYSFLFGGEWVELAAGSVATFTGNSSLTIGGEGTIQVRAAFGGIYLAAGTASIKGASSLTVSAGTFSHVVCGGHIAAGTSTLLWAPQGTSSTNTLTISGGVFLREVAAGSYNQGGRFDLNHVTNTLTISGGTFCKSVYGGNISKNQELAKSVNNKSPIDMKINSKLYVNIDSSEHAVLFSGTASVVLGSRYQGNIGGKGEVKFSGIAENLTFSSQSLVLGGSECANEDEPRFTGARSLVFDSYRSSGSGAGTFAPQDLLGFDRITLSGDSNVRFAGSGKNGTGFDLTNISYWNFEYGSTLEWTFGTNSFFSDSMAISLNGKSVQKDPWTIFVGSAATMTDWDSMGLYYLLPVTIDGVEAEWDDTNNWYATSEYKIYREENSLKFATLA